MITPADLIFTELETITAYDIASGDFMFILDELQSGSLNQTQENQEVTGKQGRKLANIKRNKGLTVSGSNGVVSSGLLALQTGGKFNKAASTVRNIDYATVDASHTVKTEFKAVGTEGAEIIAVKIKNADGVITDTLEQAAAAAAGKFKYDPATKTVTLHTDVKEGTEVLVIYDRKIADAMKMDDMSDVYSGKAKLYIDVLAEDKCANVYHVQYYVPKADFSGEWTLDMGDNQTVHNFEAEALVGACGAGGNLFSMTIFGADAKDAA